jgi:hypothetical protein
METAKTIGKYLAVGVGTLAVEHIGGWGWRKLRGTDTKKK